MSKRHDKRIKLSQMFCSDELNILKTSRCRKVYVTVKSQLQSPRNQTPTSRNQKRRERKSICGRQNCQQLRKENCHLTNGDDMTSLYCQLGRLEWRVSRRCDRTLAGSWDETRSPMVRNVPCTVGGFSDLAPTD